MKRHFLAITGAIAALAGCTSTLEPTAEPDGEGIFATIEQPTLPLQTKSLSWENDALKFTWGKYENVVVSGDKDVALLRTMNAGEQSSKLESKGFQLMDGVNYYAFIPAYNFNITTDITSIPLTFEGQRQDKNNNTAHLKYYDYACAAATKAEGSNSLEFKLQNQVAWIVVEHLCTEDMTGVTSITLSTEDKLFTSSCKFDVTTSEYGKYGKNLSNTLTLDLGTAGGSGLDFAKGEYMRVFFTTAPVDLTGKELTITAKKADGTSVELLKKTSDASCNIEKNKTVVIRTSDATPAATVATLDGREFSSLEDAIAAAEQSGKSATINLTNDVTSNLIINYTKGKALTLKLNGHKLTAETGDAVILKEGELDIINGTIESKDGIGVKFDPQANGAIIRLDGCNVLSKEGAVCTSTAANSTIWITGGTFSASDNAVIAGNGSTNHKDSNIAREGGNTIRIRKGDTYGIPVFNGKITTDGYIACGIYAPWKDTFIIDAAKFNIENGVGILCRGGKITVNDAEIITSESSTDHTGWVGDTKRQVPCKTFYKDSNCGYPDIENADIDIKGGKYSDDAGKPYVADNSYSYAETGESPLAYKVIANETKLTEAVSNVEKGGTVTIDYPVSLRNQLKIQKDFTLALSEGANIQGDCKSPALHFCQDGGSNTINGKGVIYGGADSDAAILVNGQTLTIGCENESDLQITGGSSSNFASAITIWDGKLVINNGTFISGTDESGNDSPAIYLMAMDQYDAPELEINGGVFSPAPDGSAKFLINCKDEDIARCKITIKGGTFIGFNPAASIADKINGEPANWVAKGYVSVEDSDNPGTWIVKPESVNP